MLQRRRHDVQNHGLEREAYHPVLGTKAPAPSSSTGTSLSLNASVKEPGMERGSSASWEVNRKEPPPLPPAAVRAFVPSSSAASSGCSRTLSPSRKTLILPEQLEVVT